MLMHADIILIITLFNPFAFGLYLLYARENTYELNSIYRMFVAFLLQPFSALYRYRTPTQKATAHYCSTLYQ